MKNRHPGINLNENQGLHLIIFYCLTMTLFVVAERDVLN